jgi:hypothetical protein
MLDWRKAVENNYLTKAKLIVDSEVTKEYSDEERSIREIVIALCIKYGFKYQFVNEGVFIYSIIDEWYFDLDRNFISLLHRNKLHSTKQFHFQKKFKNVVHALQYIKKHDNFNYKPNNNHKYNSIFNLLKQNKNTP